jgi:hypothetical protein
VPQIPITVEVLTWMSTTQGNLRNRSSTCHIWTKNNYSNCLKWKCCSLYLSRHHPK